MAWINLVFLGAGIGVGLIARRSLIRRPAKERPQDMPSDRPINLASDSLASDSLASDSLASDSLASDSSQVASDSLASDSSQALYEHLLHTQLAYQMAIEMQQFKAGFLARTS
ncbi:MAG: hypothetical protein ACFE0J_06025, partial [Elainellaceae cyanobacterium]